MDNLTGSRWKRYGAMNEDRCFNYLNRRYPLIKWSWDARDEKSIYDISGEYALIDVVGIDNRYRLLTWHKDLSIHIAKATQTGKRGYIAFQYPVPNIWFFLPIDSHMLDVKRPVIDGYLLSHCVEPIHGHKEEMFKDVYMVAEKIPDHPHTIALNIPHNMSTNTEGLEYIKNYIRKNPQLSKVDMVIKLTHT